MYYSGVIEHWGRGLSMIFEECKRAGLPQPKVTDEMGVIRVTFMRPNLLGHMNGTINGTINDASRHIQGDAKVKGLERDKIKQRVLKFVEGTGQRGAKRHEILEYLKDILPSINAEEQNQVLVKNILTEMRKDGIIRLEGKVWFGNK